ncbi:MAG TPA: 4Fe-4S binding protein [Candidatus Galloscillospira excrementipullorum]|nr:4Fe-4S binding protein [Candidatus Galloscillospira excrementipullorum]
MKRKMIKIDKEKCNGCGACAAACHEGAIAMTGGKARLVREDYCDGLGDCLPACPTGAISFEVREAPAYDRAAVLAAKKKAEPDALPCGCPGTQGRAIRREQCACCDCAGGREAESRLSQWPVQIRLVAGNAPYFDGANLLVAADCTAYAFGNFHEKFIQGRVTLIGCPKLDDVDYAEKLTAIFRENDIRSVTVVRMEVPCCGGMEKAVTRALQASGRQIPVQVVTISVNGKILS